MLAFIFKFFSIYSLSYVRGMIYLLSLLAGVRGLNSTVDKRVRVQRCVRRVSHTLKHCVVVEISRWRMKCVDVRITNFIQYWFLGEIKR